MRENLKRLLGLVALVVALAFVVGSLTTLSVLESAIALGMGLVSTALPVGIPIGDPAALVGSVADPVLGIAAAVGLAEALQWAVAAIVSAGALIATFGSSE